MARRRVKKSSSAGRFRARVSKTHPVNLANPMRGGIRL